MDYKIDLDGRIELMPTAGKWLRFRLSNTTHYHLDCAGRSTTCDLVRSFRILHDTVPQCHGLICVPLHGSRFECRFHVLIRDTGCCFHVLSVLSVCWMLFPCFGCCFHVSIVLGPPRARCSPGRWGQPASQICSNPRIRSMGDFHGYNQVDHGHDRWASHE